MWFSKTFQSREGQTCNTMAWKLLTAKLKHQKPNTTLYLSKIFVVRQIVSCFWGLRFNSATNFTYLRFYNARECTCSRWIISLLVSFLLLSMQRVWYLMLRVFWTFADLGLDCIPKIKCKGLPGKCFMFSWRSSGVSGSIEFCLATDLSAPIFCFHKTMEN